MTFTSPSEPIVELEDVNLVFHAGVHRSWTLREAFVRFAKDPVGAVLAEKDRLHVARDVSLTARQGDVIALVGVNGSGKTSLCRAIAGIYRPASGEVRVRGEVRAIFDTSVGIMPELTGRENAHLLSQFMFPGDPDRKMMVEEALEFSELGKFVDMPYRLYSNGMQARLCLSMISCKPCDVLILDEVFDGADAFFREKIASRVRDLIARSGAVFFVSHSPQQVREVCNRVVVLHQGRVAFDGGVEEGLMHYESLGPSPSA